MNFSIKIFKIDSDKKTKANVSVTIDNAFAVTGIRIVEGKDNKLFVSMPQEKVKDEWKDICFPVTKEFREELYNAILDEYKK